MGDAISLTIPYDPSRGCMNARFTHWAKEREEASVAKGLGIIALAEVNYPEFEGEVEVSYHVCRGRMMDRAAVIEGMKHVIDGLCSRRKYGVGIVEDDAVLHHGPVTFETGKKFAGREAKVILTFRPKDG